MSLGEARELLGVRPGADVAALAHAYRAAVKAAHPDRDGGDVERLRQVIEAHKLLSSVVPPPLVFTLVRRPAEARPNALRRLSVQISVTEALFGGEHPIQTGPGRRLNVHLPAGLRSGDTLKLTGADGGADLMLKIAVSAEPGLTVRGSDVCLEVEISAATLHAGACLEVDTPRGRQVVLMPRAAEEGGMVMVRFKGQGLPPRGNHPAGDLVVGLILHESRGRALLRRFTTRRAA